MFGIAKRKMFGKSPTRWPKLQKLVEQGVLLQIDVAYAQTQVPHGSEEEAASHAAIFALSRQGHLFVDKNRIEDPLLARLVRQNGALPKNAYFEDQIVAHVKRLLNDPFSDRTLPPLAELTEEQKKAVQNALQFPISLLTGGPGTGKTFTAAHIVRAFNTSTILAAPTGKAASHLQSKLDSSVHAGTLHSLLGVRSALDYLKEPETLDAKLVIVDECSMIPPPLFGRLLASIAPGTTLVLMGDCNQLPAVEGGSVFADLIDSKKIPTTLLTKCLRSDRREILDLGSAILRGEVQEMRTLDLGFAQKDVEKIYQQLWLHVKDLDFNVFRILSTLRKGPLGVDAINQFLFSQFSTQTDQFPIMISRNDDRTGLYNGDTGLLIKDKKALFPGGREFSLLELPSYEYAYCISVHKSQGSEYDHVLFLVPDGSEAFGREVLYTAVTRAKHRLEVDGNPTQIAAALKNSSRKMSRIVEKIKEMIILIFN